MVPWLCRITACTYDSIGNPTSYYNGTRWSFDWVEGRRLNEATTTSGSEDVSVSYTYDSDGLRMGKTVTTQEKVKNGLYVDEDEEIRYYEDGVATYAGLVAVDGYFYYFNSSKVAVRNNPAYSISKTNDILPGGTYAFDAQGRMYNLPAPAVNDDGSVKNGLLTDDDGQLRYYVNGYDSYAGLVYVGGYYYYINSSRTAVRNCQYYTTKHNDLLPAGTYTFDANGQMINPPSTASTYGLERSTEEEKTPLATIVEEYDYIYIGSQLAQMVIKTSRNGGTATEEILNFAYDASGMPATVSYDGVTYYYITNLQGDVLAIVDGHGATLVEYEYDPYGRLRSMTGVMSTTLGEANPLRYRGYVYDTETKLYYLQSRYYDPEMGRFINADSLVSTGQGVLGYNMFAYCLNNPVNLIDSNGLYPEFPDIPPTAQMGKEFAEWFINTDENERDDDGNLTFAAKLKRTIISILYNLELSAGVGVGVEQGFEVLDLGGSLGGRLDFICVQYCDGEFEFGQTINFAAVVSATRAFEFGGEVDLFIQDGMAQDPTLWIIYNNTQESWTIYNYINYTSFWGGNIRVGFDLNTFLYDMDETWELG